LLISTIYGCGYDFPLIDGKLKINYLFVTFLILAACEFWGQMLVVIQGDSFVQSSLMKYQAEYITG
jgi:hypothetical protein